MKTITIDFENFGDSYMDLLPWLNDINLEELAKIFIDDINGIASISRTIGFESGKEDYSKMSSTLTYICRNSGFEVTTQSMEVLKAAISKILREILEVLVAFGSFSDAVYSVKKCIYTGPNSSTINNLIIVLDIRYISDYGPKINSLVGQIAYEILDAFAGNRRDRRINRRSRRRVPA